MLLAGLISHTSTQYINYVEILNISLDLSAIYFARFMYQSIPSLTIPLGDPRGFAHSSCPWGRVFSPLSCPGVFPGVLNQSKSSIILKKSAVFTLSLKQMSSSSFHMFIYARSVTQQFFSYVYICQQCDSGPIYTITNMQRIRIHPGELKFILVKISPDPGRLHGKHAQENQILFTFLTTENLSGLPCSHECKYKAYSYLSS